MLEKIGKSLQDQAKDARPVPRSGELVPPFMEPMTSRLGRPRAMGSDRRAASGGALQVSQT